jgi:hypothetical protein
VTLAQLEFAYEPLLSHQRQPRAIFAELDESAKFFVELVSMQYKAKNEEPRDLDERRREAARVAWSILREWRRPPGADNQGQIDAERLRSWVAEARRLLAERDRAEVGDQAVGEILSGAVPGPDEIWPPGAVRDLIEELKSQPLEEGLELGVMNSRGITTRGAYAGGDQERALVERYTGYASVPIGSSPASASWIPSGTAGRASIGAGPSSAASWA